MGGFSFEWDIKKSIENKQKHGVSFEEAETVFYDDRGIEFFDPDHSRDEDRFIMLGISGQLRVLVVCHCHRRGKSIRIISARKANSREEKDYWGMIR